MVTVTLDEITLNAVKAALDERIANLEKRIERLNSGRVWGPIVGVTLNEDAQRAIVWTNDALLQTKLAREYLGDPEVLVDHPADATPESELRYAWGDR